MFFKTFFWGGKNTSEAPSRLLLYQANHAFCMRAACAACTLQSPLFSTSFWARTERASEAFRGCSSALLCEGLVTHRLESTGPRTSSRVNWKVAWSDTVVHHGEYDGLPAILSRPVSFVFFGKQIIPNKANTYPENVALEPKIKKKLEFWILCEKNLVKMKGKVSLIFWDFSWIFTYERKKFFVKAEAFLVRSRGKFNYFQEIKS